MNKTYLGSCGYISKVTGIDSFFRFLPNGRLEQPSKLGLTLHSLLLMRGYNAWFRISECCCACSVDGVSFGVLIGSFARLR